MPRKRYSPTEQLLYKHTNMISMLFYLLNSAKLELTGHTPFQTGSPFNKLAGFVVFFLSIKTSERLHGSFYFNWSYLGPPFFTSSNYVVPHNFYPHHFLPSFAPSPLMKSLSCTNKHLQATIAHVQTISNDSPSFYPELVPPLFLTNNPSISSPLK